MPMKPKLGGMKGKARAKTRTTGARNRIRAKGKAAGNVARKRLAARKGRK